MHGFLNSVGFSVALNQHDGHCDRHHDVINHFEDPLYPLAPTAHPTSVILARAPDPGAKRVPELTVIVRVISIAQVTHGEEGYMQI